jgi:hypothetical protein
MPLIRSPRYVLLALTLALSSLSAGLLADANFANGSIYTSLGTSGTAADSPSSSGLIVYRYNAASEQAVFPDSVTPTVITAAGGGNPAKPPPSASRPDHRLLAK